MTMTARDLVSSSYRLVGVLAAGQTMSGDRAAIGLETLNQMLDAWNADGFSLFSTTTSVINTVAGTAAYTIGPTGDVVVASRPSALASVAFRDNGVDYPLTILEAADYNLIASKSDQSGNSFFLYYEPSFPNGMMTLYPVPNAVKQLVVQHLALHSSSLTLDSVISFPPAYTMSIRFNLAVLLSIESGRQQVNPQVAQVAYETKTTLERANTRVPTLSYDFGQVEYDINIGR